MASTDAGRQHAEGRSSRRSVLKAVGAGALGIGAASGVASADGTFDVQVFNTEALANNGTWTGVISAVQEYVDGAFDSVSEYDVDVGYGGSVDAPSQDVYGSGNDWDGLVNWWNDELGSIGSHRKGDHSNLLVTNSDANQGKAKLGGNAAVCSCAGELSDAGYHQLYDSAPGNKGANIALEEIGHNLQNDPIWAWNQYDAHKTGMFHKLNGSVYASPLSSDLSLDGTDNVCGDSVPSVSQTFDYYQSFADCSVNKFNDP